MVVCLQVKAKVDFERILEYSRAFDHLYPINTLYLLHPFAHYIPGLWLHATKKKNLAQPYFANLRCSLHKMLTYAV